MLDEIENSNSNPIIPSFSHSMKEKYFEENAYSNQDVVYDNYDDPYYNVKLYKSR